MWSSKNVENEYSFLNERTSEYSVYSFQPHNKKLLTQSFHSVFVAPHSTFLDPLRNKLGQISNPIHIHIRSM